jgi:hypothetical protein
MFAVGNHGYRWCAVQQGAGGWWVALVEAIVITVGGVDTYYDYDECQWKFRRLGGGPVHPEPAGPSGDEQPAEAGAEVIPSPDSAVRRPDALRPAR